MCGRQYFNAIAAVTAFAIGLNTVRCTLGQFGSDLVILSEDLLCRYSYELRREGIVHKENH